MSKKREKRVGVKAVNPLYQGANMRDVARALVTNPKIRERLEKRWQGKDEDASSR